LTSTPGKVHYQRRTRYVDETVQKWLIVCLVLLEIGLVTGLSWLLYLHLNQAIEENLYRVHLAKAAPLLNQLLHAAWPLLGMFLFVNALVLLFVYMAWRQYMNVMLRQFMMLIGKTQQLDFSPDSKQTSYRFELLLLTEAQRAQERQRLTAIREQVSRLGAEVSAANNPQNVQDALRELETWLPTRTR
jgi:hypothetical protein